MLDQDDWRCPTCLDLLFKPAVNTCGHAYCFWCFHRAMSPYTPSACPVCRAQYGHLPAICAKLHRFLAAQFPEQYAARRAETEAEEEESGAQSPEPEAGPVPPPAAPGAWRPEHFACDSPSCGKLLCRPAVLNCGHCVCLPTCLAGSEELQGSQAAASPPAALAARHECPACGMAARQLPVVCKQLADLVAELFPAESQQREQEVAAQLAAAAAAAVAAGAAAAAAAAAAAGGSGGAGEAEQVDPLAAEQAAVGMEGGEPGTPHASAAQSEGGTAPPPAAASDEPAPQQGAQQAGGPAEDSQQAQQGAQQAQQQQTLSPSLESALRRRQAEGGPASDLAQRLEENLRRLTSGASYVHHGVGCDACGLYPITGRRYKCEDCPEAMGFDLCGDCMDRGVSDIVGRFNQRHTPQHRMVLVRPRITAMHMLQAANPELPMQQLLSLLELMWREDDDETGQQEEQGQQAQQAQQGQQAQHSREQQQNSGDQGQQGQQQGISAGGSNDAAAAGGQTGGSHGGSGHPTGGASSSGSGVDFPHLRRGPRPAFDGHAVEPSPSAFRNWHPPAEWASAQHAHGQLQQLQQQQQQQQQQQEAMQQQPAALGGEVQGLIEEEEQEGASAVHVPLERVLPPRPPR